MIVQYLNAVSYLRIYGILLLHHKWITSPMIENGFSIFLINGAYIFCQCQQQQNHGIIY